MRAEKMDEEYREKLFITVDELAVLMRIGRTSAYKYVKSDSCPFQRLIVGQRITIPTNAFFAWYDGLKNA